MVCDFTKLQIRIRDKIIVNFQIWYILQCCVEQDGSGGNTSGLYLGHAGFQSQMKK